MNIFVRKLRFKSSRELYHYTIVAFQIELDPKMSYQDFLVRMNLAQFMTNFSLETIQSLRSNEHDA